MQPNDIAAIIFLVLVLYLFVTRKQRKVKKEAKRTTRKEKYANKLRNMDVVVSGQHMTGLPIAQGVQCSVSYLSDKIEITQGKNTFNLDIAKITDITTTTDVEIQKNYVSSVGGAVGGAVLFGPLGAMVGGRAKEKKTTTMTHYLVITYKADNEIKYISFEVIPSANTINFVSKFNSNDHEKNVVDL